MFRFLKRNIEDKDITEDEINLFVRQGAVIIDVRSPQEYREGHIDGAICIPDYKIKKEIENRIPNKNELIILYCSTGHRSKRCQYIMQNMGYMNVYNIKTEIV